MKPRKLTQDQIQQLLNNENVTKCSSKSITYSKEFKLKAVKQYYDKGISAKQIFKEGGFDLNMFRKDLPDDRVREWRKIYKERGIEGLSIETRGKSKGINKGRPRMKGLTDKEKIERLELTVAYQKEKILFLAELRAKRKE